MSRALALWALLGASLLAGYAAAGQPSDKPLLIDASMSRTVPAVGRRTNDGGIA